MDERKYMNKTTNHFSRNHNNKQGRNTGSAQPQNTQQSAANTPTSGNAQKTQQGKKRVPILRQKTGKNAAPNSNWNRNTTGGGKTASHPLPNQKQKATGQTATVRETEKKTEKLEFKGSVKTQPRVQMETLGGKRHVNIVLQDHPMISQNLTFTGKKPESLRSYAGAHAPKGTLRMIPLGGMCEIGKNMTAYEYGNDIIIVDVGQIFPDESMPGVDAVIPDFKYVLDNKDRVRGIFITHGHEDHIGGLPYLMERFKAPIYGGKMTIELIRYKLNDRISGLGKSCELKVVEAGDTIKAGCFSVECIHVNHSIEDAFMFAIRTPAGIIMHSGDFKIDYTPINGGIMDLQRIAEIGKEGVLLFVCESTNIEVPGFTKSERHVGETMAQMFAGATGRIFVATFSSNTSRLQQIFTAAERVGRKVALVGRSMLNVFNAANSLGYIQMKKDTLIEISDLDKYEPSQVVIISTGSQGEPMSALTKIAFANHKEVEILPGDTVILSSTPIPGNEKPIYKVINELYRRGATVYYSALADVHVSGHASQEEIKLVHELIKPKYFIPAHGETRMLYQHAEMAHKLGMPFENIFILANGDIFEIGRNGAKVAGFTNGDAVLVDGSSTGDADSTVLRERRMLSDDGVVAIALAVSAGNGVIIGMPAVSAMGFLYDSEHEKIEAACRKHIAEYAQKISKLGKKIVQEIDSGRMQGELRSFLFNRTKRRPVVMINVIEV